MRKSIRESFDAIHDKFEADKAKGFEDYISFDVIMDEHYGPVGTPRRDRWDRNAARHRKAFDIAARVTRPYGIWGTFWRSFLFEAPGSLRAAADAMSFQYLGDFLFYNDPVTEDYYQSWMSRVHFPRWLHYHVGPEEECTHV